ncbi:uncharacterized protein LOC121504350 [Cheilinus undulatus]|uniref:uncharacterized protein LOC121504350 n=1 Tax=Cheilinus undulatus TaxID=241271 RepID=UPI001BD1C73A|nr:uncharacterized protein LOC121504350 [Cheilinus undulatus]
MVLLVAQINQSHSAQNADRVFPRITPDRLQFFEYETVHISCEELMGLTGWRVMHRHNKPTNSHICTPPASRCTIEPAFERHSGEYWCENNEGNTTGSINISVTAGSVILEVPARPVMEGSDVTLFCKNQKFQSEHIADFYKDDVSLGSGYSHITIRNVSKSHEGLYKCSISGAAQSPESWLAVRKKENPKPNKEIQPPQKHSPHHSTILWIAVSISLTVIFLFVLGFFLCQKHQASVGNNADEVTYAQVESFRRDNGSYKIY